MFTYKLKLLHIILFFTVVVSISPGKAQISNFVSQTGSIEGFVLDVNSGKPLFGVNVMLKGTTFGSATDSYGHFIIEKVPYGNYSILVSRIGYNRIVREVKVSKGELLDLSFNLSIHPVKFDKIVVERTSLIGNKDRMFKIPGSAHYLDAHDLAKQEYNDIHRALREIPGINIQEEDGYGLRPNIGFRGTGSERTSKITVMEDGILQAPAPYSAPAAYYFPTVGRMSGIEVRKGSSQIKFGPFTTGGVLNLISTPIPSQFDGTLEILAGEDDFRRIHATAGHSLKNFGFLAETFQARTDGFKELDGGGNTGFDKKDYILKLRFNTNPGSKVYQQLSFKFTQTDETSDETYLGLTDEDFAKNHVRRYAASQNDVINTEHTQFVIRHFIKPAQAFDFTSSFYRTDFQRNWYKLDHIRATEDGSRTRIADVLADQEIFAAEFTIATGQSSPNDNALEVKANNREYYAWGIKTQAGLQFNLFNSSHEAEFGIGYHEDQIDRFQWVDLFRMDNNVMELTQAGIPGTESNLISAAKVWTGYAQINLNFGKLSALPGIRYEKMELTRNNFGIEDPERTGVNLSFRENNVDVLIPGFGLDYKFSPTFSTFFGVHQGFSPPGASEGTEPEESINYEFGARLNQANLGLQAVIFFNDYSNLLGSDLVAAGGEGSGDRFNGGEVDVRGVEFALNYDIANNLGMSNIGIPFRIAYTYTNAKFKNSFESDFAPWDNVTKGDKLPYIPENQLFASIGIEGARYTFNFGAKYNAKMRTVAGQDDFIESMSTDAHIVFDLSAAFNVTDANKVFVTVRNLFDEIYIAARRPAGARPGLPRLILAGIKTNF